jgi:cyanate permease
MAIAAPMITGYIAQSTHSFATATVIVLVGNCGYAFLPGRIGAVPEPALRPLKLA